MNSRDYKPNYPGAFFHAFNRGVKKEAICFDEQDYQNFLYRAKVIAGIIPPPKRTMRGGIRLTPLPHGAIEILAYCIMPNHYHFLIKQRDVGAMQQFLRRLCTSYASYINKKYDRVGHLFQGIYKCKNVLEDSYLTHLSAYIHLNPPQPFDWKYSSLSEYMGTRTDNFVSTHMLRGMHNLTPGNYKNFLLTQFDPAVLEEADLLFD